MVKQNLWFEKMLNAAEVYGITSVKLRYFNVAGCAKDGSIGEMHEPETHIIPIALEVAAGKRESFSIFGTDYDTPDGTCIRDYVYVEEFSRRTRQSFRVSYERKEK
jgi:UDP-glucose 4-epimerase